MNNLERMAGILAKRMQQTAKASQPMGLDFGRITDDNLTLVTDKLRANIPADGYTVLSGVELENGSRVVVAWIGNEPVLLGTI